MHPSLDRESVFKCLRRVVKAKSVKKFSRSNLVAQAIKFEFKIHNIADIS